MKLTFKCDYCGCKQLEEVWQEIVLKKVIGIDNPREGLLVFEYGKVRCEAEESRIVRYQCSKCKCPISYSKYLEETLIQRVRRQNEEIGKV